MEYLINVALGFVPPAITIAMIYVVANIVLKRLPQTKHVDYKKKYTNPAAGVALAIALVLAMTNQSITYKHQPHDQARETQHIEQLNAQKHSKTETLVIKDDAKPIKGVNENEFDDMVEFNNDGRD